MNSGGRASPPCCTHPHHPLRQSLSLSPLLIPVSNQGEAPALRVTRLPDGKSSSLTISCQCQGHTGDPSFFSLAARGARARKMKWARAVPCPGRPAGHAVRGSAAAISAAGAGSEPAARAARGGCAAVIKIPRR